MAIPALKTAALRVEWHMEETLDFMTPAHHAVRSFVVRELPRSGGAPLPPRRIAAALHLSVRRVIGLLDDLERHLFFVVRDTAGDVTWAFPVTVATTPHRLRFSTGERISGAWAEDAFATPFVEGRLRNQRLQVEIITSCAHCARPMHIVVDERLQWRVQERGADPHVFLPHIDWGAFRGRNIIGDYWTHSVFVW
jgi:hypothetical protein